MHARGARQECEVRAIIHDYGRAMRLGDPHHRVAQVEKVCGRKLFGADLNPGGATIQEGAREIGGRPAGALSRIDIQDGVEGGYDASASDPVALGAGANRSMNEVFTFPAAKSGSLMIFNCSDTVVLMPSTTVISSVRRMRAIAS